MPLHAVHLIFFALILICGPAFARTTDAALCDQAAERAALPLLESASMPRPAPTIP